MILHLPGIRLSIRPLPPTPPGISRREVEREAAIVALRDILPPDRCDVPEISHTPSGAPFIPSCPGLSLSISHSASHVAVAVSSTHHVGIDIEQWRPSLQRVARRFLSESEFPYFSSTPRTLLTAWTVKEATFKLLNSPGLLPEPPKVMTTLPLFSPDIELHVIDLGEAPLQLITIARKRRLRL